MKTVARLHAFAVGGFMALYIGLSFVYSPDVLLSDIRDKWRAFALDTISITARVLAPPVQPTVTVAPACDTTVGVLSIGLDWADDVNSVSYDVTRDGLPLVTGLSSSSYTDTSVAVGTSYTYEVTARGPMGPGFAVSDPVVATTPAVCSIVFVPKLTIMTFDGKAFSHFSGTPTTTERRPEFSGTTNIPNAKIDILLNSSVMITAQATANATGYWSWRPPVDLSYDTHTIFVTSSDPGDPSVSASLDFPFEVVKESSGSGGGGGGSKKKWSSSAAASSPGIVTPETPQGTPSGQSNQPPVSVPGAPFHLVVSLASAEVYQGRDFPFSIAFTDVKDAVRGVTAVARYTVTDADGNEKLSSLENIAISDRAVSLKKVAIPSYFKEGKYRLKVEILIDQYDVSQEERFTVIPLPFLSPGGGFVITYSEFLSRIGTFSLLLALLLCLWIFFFYREYMLYLRALRHITERNLARAGFFGGKGVSY